MIDLLNAIPLGFDSMVYCVPAGTVVGQDDDGIDMVVTDTIVVNDDNKWWCTEKVFNLIKEKTAKRLS